MNKLYPSVDVKGEAPIALALKHINLHDWLLNAFSTLDYRASAKGHWAMGSSVNHKNQPMLINVESVGGHLMVQNYVITVSTKEHLQFVSEASDLWLFHLIHMYVRVTTDIKVIATNQENSLLVCHILSQIPNPIFGFLSRLDLSQYFSKKHCKEETDSFAANLFKFASNSISN
jgi:hypothetical protein